MLLNVVILPSLPFFLFAFFRPTRNKLHVATQLFEMFFLVVNGKVSGVKYQFDIRPNKTD